MNEKQIIEKYSELIKRFLDGEATAEEFSTNYMDTFIEEEADLSEGTYQILTTTLQRIRCILCRS